MVTVRGKKVKWFDECDNVRTTKVAAAFETNVEDALKKWARKKAKEPETDSE